MNNTDKLIDSLNRKFTSGNDCEVSQATITREEYEAIAELTKQRDELQNALAECLQMAEDIDSHGVLDLERKEQVAHFEALSTEEANK